MIIDRINVVDSQMLTDQCAVVATVDEDVHIDHYQYFKGHF